MKRNIFLFVGAVIAFSVVLVPRPVAAQAARPLKVAVVDLQTVFNESDAGKEKIAVLQKLEERYTTELQDAQNKIKAKEDQLQQLPFSISEEKRTSLAREIDEDKIALKRRQSDAERDLSTRQNDAMMELYSKIVPVIEDIGKTQGYTIVFNKVQPSVLLYWDSTVDLTQDVIKKFNGISAKPKK
jgi:outer membrane protein